jgi:hypothetical protein
MTLLTCRAVTRRLAAFHDRELPVPELIAIESHVNGCPPCAGRLRELQLVGEALRLAAAPGPSDDWTGLQPGVISRMRAETYESLTSRMRRTFDDMHLVWIGLAATVATVVCAAVALGSLHYASQERDDSLAAIIAFAAQPVGSDLNPIRLENYIRVPTVPGDGPMAATLAGSAMSEDELETAISAVVTRDGRVSGLSVLTNDRDRRELDMIIEGILRAKLEPARWGHMTINPLHQSVDFGESPIAVNLVWLLTHTTVRAKMPRTT